MAAPQRRRTKLVEVVEAALLALVAIFTAWSGYQSAKWDGHQSTLYGQSSRLRFEASAASTRAGQEQLYDALTVNSWLNASVAGNKELAKTYEARLRPEFRPAFEAWLKTDPLHDANAPPGPMFVAQYRNALLAKADALNTRASATFALGETARHHGDEYVRVTVLFATVLFLLALSQRFTIHAVRLGLIGVAFALFAVALVAVVSYPRL